MGPLPVHASVDSPKPRRQAAAPVQRSQAPRAGGRLSAAAGCGEAHSSVVADSHDQRSRRDYRNRGKGIASPDQPREPKQSWRPQGPTGLDVRDHDSGTEFAESRFRASRVTFVRRQRPYRRSPRSRSSGCCSARAKRSSHRCRDKRCSVSSKAQPSGYTSASTRACESAVRLRLSLWKRARRCLFRRFEAGARCVRAVQSVACRCLPLDRGVSEPCPAPSRVRRSGGVDRLRPHRG